MGQYQYLSTRYLGQYRSWPRLRAVRSPPRRHSATTRERTAVTWRSETRCWGHMTPAMTSWSSDLQSAHTHAYRLTLERACIFNLYSIGLINAYIHVHLCTRAFLTRTRRKQLERQRRVRTAASFVLAARAVLVTVTHPRSDDAHRRRHALELVGTTTVVSCTSQT